MSWWGVNREKNELRFYYLAWPASLFDEGTTVQIYGRHRRHHQRWRITVYQCSWLRQAS
jgi:alpha-L-fucosidase